MSASAIALSEQQAQIRTIIQLLAQQISQDLGSVNSNGLLSGLAGHLLFLFNAYKLDNSFVQEAIFSERLEQLQEQLDEQSFELSSGLAGQAWLLEYLNQSNFDDYDAQLLSDVDTLFYDALNHQPWAGEIEYVLGLAGYAPYAARRSKFTDQSALYGVIVKNFASIAQHLDDDHISWSQPAHSVYRFDKDNLTKPEFNLGLAHGVPGIIAALLPALKIDSLREQTKSLVTQSCDWLLAQQNPNQEDECRFGTCVGDEHRSRLGWCYGDLTIALTLARAGHALDKANYLESALAIALKATKRDAKSAAINDAGLCHGSVGLVVIFQLLNRLLPHPDLQKATYYWLDYSLNTYQEKGLEAFYSFNGVSQQLEKEHGFLMGYSGIGMAFVSLLTGEFDWTECLLMA